MTGKRKTIASLEDRIAGLEASLQQVNNFAGERVREANAAADREKQTRKQFDDLKLLLATTESENARMRGYIARVQEDDVVREDLIPIGDPEGQMQLTAKRKPTNFEPAVVTSNWQAELRPALSPKRWVNY